MPVMMHATAKTMKLLGICAHAELSGLDDGLDEGLAPPEVSESASPPPLPLPSPPDDPVSDTSGADESSVGMGRLVAVAPVASPVIWPAPWLIEDVRYSVMAVLLTAWSLLTVAPVVGDG